MRLIGRRDKMFPRTLIRYRTTESRHPFFVIVPNLFVSSMIQWLSDDECAEIERVEGTDNLCSVPQRYPDHDACVSYIRDMNLIGA